MHNTSLPIVGLEHLAIAEHADKKLHIRFLDALRKAGFIIEPTRVLPPAALPQNQVIIAVSLAFQAAQNSRP